MKDLRDELEYLFTHSPFLKNVREDTNDYDDSKLDKIKTPRDLEKVVGKVVLLQAQGDALLDEINDIYEGSPALQKSNKDGVIDIEFIRGQSTLERLNEAIAALHEELTVATVD